MVRFGVVRMKVKFAVLHLASRQRMIMGVKSFLLLKSYFFTSYKL